MHKCMMVKVGGNEKHRKYVKKHVNLPKKGGICKSRGERILFLKLGECIEIAKIGGNLKFVVDD